MVLMVLAGWMSLFSAVVVDMDIAAAVDTVGMDAAVPDTGTADAQVDVDADVEADAQEDEEVEDREAEAEAEDREAEAEGADEGAGLPAENS